MSEPGENIAGASATAPVAAGSEALSGAERGMIEGRVHARMAVQARSLHLSQQLRINAIVEMSGWLRDRVEVHYRRGRGGTIRPVLVRVGQDAADREVLESGGIFGRCGKYNGAIDRLRELALQLTRIVGRRIEVAPGTALAAAQAELAQLDDTIARRQAAEMAHGMVRLDVLAAETAFFESRATELTAIVLEAERSASANWDGDTQDLALDD